MSSMAAERTIPACDPETKQQAINRLRTLQSRASARGITVRDFFDDAELQEIHTDEALSRLLSLESKLRARRGH